VNLLYTGKKTIFPGQWEILMICELEGNLKPSDIITSGMLNAWEIRFSRKGRQ
jgi:hypothetical protein